MPRGRPASNPVSYHTGTKQYYVTRGSKRIYLGADKQKALEKYYRLNLGLELPVDTQQAVSPTLTVKNLANRFIMTQQANWKNVKETKRGYTEWLGRFLRDHPGVLVADFTVEMFAAWKLSLRDRGYSLKSINHYLSAVRAIFAFAEDTDLIPKAPKFKRARNETMPRPGTVNKQLYTQKEISALFQHADLQLRGMILLALNCGFGPKDIHDLRGQDRCVKAAVQI